MKNEILIAKDATPQVSKGSLPVRSQRASSLMLAAESSARHGDPIAAIQHAETLLAEDPLHLGALELKARAEWKLGEYDALLGTLRRLVQANPYEPGYHALRGSALQCLGRYGEATIAMERARSIAGQSEAVAELREWQASLINDLLASDSIFRTHYRQDPVAACSARGFRIPSAQAPTIVLRQTDRAALSMRPS